MMTLLQLPARGGADPLTTAAEAVARAWGQSPDESDVVLMAGQLSSLSAPLSANASMSNAVLVRVADALVPLQVQGGQVVAGGRGVWCVYVCAWARQRGPRAHKITPALRFGQALPPPLAF